MNIDSAAQLPMPPARLSRQASLQAVEWLVRLHGHEEAALKARWQTWLSADPEHERAWHYLMESCDSFGLLPAAVAHQALGASAVDGQRRQMAKLLGLGGLAAGMGMLAWRALPWSAWQADRRTALGELASLRWVDGIVLDLNTASAINLRSNRHSRHIELVEGELMVTALDAAATHPLVVNTIAGQVDAVHARFSLHSAHDKVLARVFEGAIVLTPANLPTQAVHLTAGQAADFSAQGVDVVGQTSDLDAAWVRGMLVARDMRLSAFLAELSRYRSGYLACVPEIADLRVSGIYPLHDSDRVLDMLVRNLPVRVHRLSRYWIVIQPRNTA